MHGPINVKFAVSIFCSIVKPTRCPTFSNLFYFVVYFVFLSTMEIHHDARPYKRQICSKHFFSILKPTRCPTFSNLFYFVVYFVFLSTMEIYHDARSYKRQICSKHFFFYSKTNEMPHFLKFILFCSVFCIFIYYGNISRCTAL